MNKYEVLTKEQLVERIESNNKFIEETLSDMRHVSKRATSKKADIHDMKHVASMLNSYLERIARLEAENEELQEAIELIALKAERQQRVEQGHESIIEFLEYLLEKDMDWYKELKATSDKSKFSKTEKHIASLTEKEALKVFRKDLDSRYVKLITQVTKKVGAIQTIEVRRNFNDGFDGYVKGENGQCVLQTILAGGHSVQRLHYRTLIK